MVVSLTVRRRAVEVVIETDDAYSPDILDDMQARARDLARNVLADREHTDAEHKAE
jgi:hypothetical protein